jgi:hypothetical protein
MTPPFPCIVVSKEERLYNIPAKLGSIFYVNNERTGTPLTELYPHWHIFEHDWAFSILPDATRFANKKEIITAIKVLREQRTKNNELFLKHVGTIPTIKQLENNRRRYKEYLFIKNL